MLILVTQNNYYFELFVLILHDFIILEVHENLHFLLFLNIGFFFMIFKDLIEF